MWRTHLAVILTLATVAAGEEFMPELRQAPRPAPTALKSAAVDAAGESIELSAAWRSRRQQLLSTWQSIIGPFPNRVPLEPRVISSETLEDHTRVLVRYQNDGASRNEAYILLPKNAPAASPGMVVLHQTSKTNLRDPVGLDGRENMHIALHLVRRGYVCVVPRNFLWSFDGKNYEQAAQTILAEKPWKTGIAKMTWDAIRATDLLLEQSGVNPERVGSIGHSLGGKEVLYHAAFDDRIKAAVSCEGGVGISFSNWDASWYLGPQVKSPDFRHDHHELIGLIAPRALLIIGGESADGAKSWPYIEANLHVWRLFGAEERLGLLRHEYKHDFPPPGEDRERVYRWVDQWLKN